MPNLAAERVPAACLDYLSSVRGRDEREAMASLLRNDAFRTDLYARRLPDAVDLENSPLWDMVFTTLVPVRDIGPQLHCGSRTLARGAPLIEALLAACTEGALTLRELAAGPELLRHSPRAVLETAQMLELSKGFGFLRERAPARGPASSGPWRMARPAFGVLLRSRLRENGFGCLAAPRLGSAIRLGTLESLAVLCLSEEPPEEAAGTFASLLNREWPELLGCTIGRDWASRYLLDFDAHWHPVLRKLGTLDGV